jgi:hypothetical protein
MFGRSGIWGNQPVFRPPTDEERANRAAGRAIIAENERVTTKKHLFWFIFRDTEIDDTVRRIEDLFDDVGVLTRESGLCVHFDWDEYLMMKKYTVTLEGNYSEIHDMLEECGACFDFAHWDAGEVNNREVELYF